MCGVSREAIKWVQDLLKDATPSKMAASISTFLILYLFSIYVSFIFYLLYFVTLVDEHVQRLHGEVQ